jgi:hypothetical protein
LLSNDADPSTTAASDDIDVDDEEDMKKFTLVQVRPGCDWYDRHNTVPCFYRLIYPGRSYWTAESLTCGVYHNLDNFTLKSSCIIPCRIYVVITSTYPTLRAFIYRQGLVRLVCGPLLRDVEIADYGCVHLQAGNRGV